MSKRNVQLLCGVCTEKKVVDTLYVFPSASVTGPTPEQPHASTLTMTWSVLATLYVPKLQQKDYRCVLYHGVKGTQEITSKLYFVKQKRWDYVEKQPLCMYDPCLTIQTACMCIYLLVFLSHSQKVSLLLIEVSMVLLTKGAVWTKHVELVVIAYQCTQSVRVVRRCSQMFMIKIHCLEY